MNTEKINAIKQIRAILNNVNTSLPLQPIGSEERENMEATVLELESLIWKLVNEDIKHIVVQLNDSKEKLKAISDDLKHANADLAETGKNIEKASQIIAALVTIATTASSTGLI